MDTQESIAPEEATVDRKELLAQQFDSVEAAPAPEPAKTEAPVEAAPVAETAPVAPVAPATPAALLPCSSAASLHHQSRIQFVSHGAVRCDRAQSV